ncbi:MAG TPA: hypothetical protein VKA34_06990 [Balneolales bacterium]|nr:hypothetical protein [Balneolales bacterium]
MVPFSLGFALVLMGIGLLLMFIFGSKNILAGKYKMRKLITIVSPFVVFVITYVITGEGTQSGLITMLILLLVTALIAIGVGLRSTFNF